VRGFTGISSPGGQGEFYQAILAHQRRQARFCTIPQ